MMITQAANSAVSWRTTRKQRNDAMIAAVADVVAASHSWVYAVSSQEQDILHAIATHVTDEQRQEKLESSRASVYAAQLDYGSAIARVRLTSPKRVASAAEDVTGALQDFEATCRAKVSTALAGQGVADSATKPIDVNPHIDRLVKEARKAAGYGPAA
ncbi:hypothetical protein [Mycolicibacterium neoaurum]|uniref:hypothetical protein n=1 Tax=Mycolicibacterium neoaurum TaxID=1795 RepID=UPI001F4CC44D|nr:hypothetical protein [Mycolicibacterium neoaurum]